MRLVAIPARVPRYLKADGTRRAAQATGNLTLPIPRVTPHPDQPTFYNGHAFVSHYVLHVLQVHEERTLPGGHFHITTVALAAGARGGGLRNCCPQIQLLHFGFHEQLVLQKGNNLGVCNPRHQGAGCRVVEGRSFPFGHPANDSPPL